MQKGQLSCHTMHLQAPTVTLPRLKTLVTGSTARFSDILNNFNSPSLEEDNIIRRLAAARRNHKGWPLHFCGDDTWLKLFPKDFVRSEGISSFFVNDFHQVDVNVTRCMRESLPYSKDNTKTDDLFLWRGLILHYLGVDHIGHVRGPNGEEMGPKLRQMDQLIADMYQEMAYNAKTMHERWIIVVTGDHGMHNQGGHGGSTLEEITVPFLTFFSPQILKQNPGLVSNDSCTRARTHIDQTDVAVSLGLLTNVGIPSRSSGTFIPTYLSLLGNRLQQMKALYLNVKHLYAKHQDIFNNKNADYYHNLTEMYHNIETLCFNKTLTKQPISENICTEEFLQAFQTELQDAQIMLKSYILSRLKLYDLPCMLTGATMLLICACLWLRYLTCSEMPHVHLHRPHRLFILLLFASGLTAIVHFLICTATDASCTLCQLKSPLSWLLAPSAGLAMTLLFGMMGFTVWCDGNVLLHFQPSNISKTGWFLFVGTVLQIISLGSSSCVEEEHQIWYFFTASLHVILLVDLWYHCCYRQDYQLLVSKNHSLRQIQPPLLPMLGFVAVACIDRFVRHFHQSGDKWKFVEDFDDILSKPENYYYLSALIFVAYGFIGLLLIFERDSVHYFTPSTLLVVLTQLLYRDVLDSSIEHSTVALINYALIVLDFVCNVAVGPRNKQHLLGSLMRSFYYLMLLLCKPVNVILWALLLLKERILAFCFSHFCDFYFQRIPLLLAVVYHWHGMSTFFLLGHSNNLSSVHVSAGFVGLSSYHVVWSAVLLALHTYSGPIFWFLAFVHRFGLYFHTANAHKYVYMFSSLLSVSLFVYSCICIHLKDHLFIWSVFAPKFLFLSFNSLMNTILCCLLVAFFF